MDSDHRRVQRRSFNLTLADLFVILLFSCLISFVAGYGLSRYHSINFYGPTYDKLQVKHTQFLTDFASLEVRVGLLEGKGKKKGWR